MSPLAPCSQQQLMYVSNIYPGAIAVATGLALHGYRKGSLSQSGAVAAWFVGYGHLANPIKLFGVSMIVFYLVGSRATKIKAAVKATLEDGPDPSKPGGNRDAIQVLSNSLPSLCAALVYRLSYYASTDLAQVSLYTQTLPRRLIFLALGHFSTCLGDTLASELGILSASDPYHILTLKQVPRGTNGAVSLLGLGASALGGAIMGLAVTVDMLIENPSSRAAAVQWVPEVLLFGTASGLVGSLLDSLLGATLQRTQYASSDGRVLTDHSTQSRRDEDGVIVIGPGRDVLSNSGVNFICGIALATVGWWYASL